MGLGLAPVLWLGLQLQRHQMLGVTLLLHILVQGLHLGRSRQYAEPCSLLGLIVVLVATMVVGCLVVVSGGAEVDPCVLAGAGMGSKVAFRGVAVEDACAVLGAAVAGSSVVVLGKTRLGSSAVVLGGAVAELDGALTGCAAGARTGAGAAGSSVEVLGLAEGES